jgi:hypothetical protein
MATVGGVRYTTTDTANIAIDMSDTLTMISPYDVPLLQRIGKDSLSTPCVAVKHEWLEDSLRGLTSIVVTQGKFSSTTDPADDVVMTTGSGPLFRAGDIWRFESELVRVAATPAADTLNFVRGYGGSTAASHANGTVGYYVGNVALQDAAVGTSRTTTKTGLYNYVQLMEDSVVVTTMEKAIKKYVETNSLDAQLTRAMRTWWIGWEMALLHGRKVAPTSTVAGAMDGILVRISTNAYAKAGAYLVEDHIRTALRDVWTAGGNPDLLVCNAFQKERISQFLDNMRETTRTDKTAGAIVNRYESEYGAVDIMLDRNMPADTVLVLSTEHIGFGPFKDHATKAVPIPQTTALKETHQIIGAYTSETRAETAHAKITGLATS